MRAAAALSNQPVNSLRPARNLYGRRHGKRLRPGQRRLFEEALETVAVSGLSAGRYCGPGQIDLVSLFGRQCPVWLEVGFGSGEHLVHQAARNPDVGVIGCEPFVNGVVSLLGKLRDAPMPNIRVHPGDARDLMDAVPDASISRVFLLYPDPWPKRRHHRRRFVTPSHLQPLARIMAPGSELRLATDVADYARQAVEQIAVSDAFSWHPGAKRDWQTPWEDWLSTRYEKKALREARVPHYLTFTRF